MYSNPFKSLSDYTAVLKGIHTTHKHVEAMNVCSNLTLPRFSFFKTNTKVFSPRGQKRHFHK